MSPTSFVRSSQGRRLATFVLVLATAWTWLVLPAYAQQPNPEEKAAGMLNAGRLAFNERNYPVAAERFRAFLKDFGGHPNAASARYGLALTIMDGPEKNFAAAIELLQAAAGANIPEKPYALYYYGVALRTLGNQFTRSATAKPNEAPQLLPQAQDRYQQALGQFAAAAGAFAPTPETEWTARAKCDQCEMLIRLNRAKEALAILEPWSKDPNLAKSRYRNQANYLLGYAYFTQANYLVAGKTLGQLAPFNEPVVGVHARYLLARAHHLAEERPEAAAGYEAVIAGHAQERALAEQTLKNPGALSGEEKSRMEAFLADQPDYVVRAAFHLGILLYEQGKFADAVARLGGFMQHYGKSPLAPEAALWLGMCQVQLRQYGEAMKFLPPLGEHPQLGDQALLWMARAQVGAADVNNPQAVQQAAGAAVATLQKAYEKAKQISATDASLAPRRREALLEMGDVQQLAKQYKEAAATYQRVISDSTSVLIEPATHRTAVAMQMAGQYRESDEVCQKFLSTYPKSALAPEVQFRFAENALLAATALAGQAGQENEAKRLLGEAVKRYQPVVEKAGDASFANLARQGLGTALYQTGQFEAAAKALAAIADPDRNGDLAATAYLIADCQLRTLPASADDALSMARVIEQLNEATALLNGFVAAQPNAPQIPDALIKLGYCQQRVAGFLADPAEKQKATQAASLAYGTFMQKFGNRPQLPVALMEHARCAAQLGDVATAMAELGRFNHDQLKNTPIAPLALIRLGEYQRTRNPADAVAQLTATRAAHEANLLKDPARAEWVPLLQYNLALALKDAGKPAEAKALFENIAQQFPQSAEGGESIWRAAQVRREESLAKIDAARKALVAAAGKPAETAAAKTLFEQAMQGLREAGDGLKAKADPLAAKPELAGLRLRMLYEAAWISRALGSAEVEVAREKMALEAIRKQQLAAAGKESPVAHYIVQTRAEAIVHSAVPLQPGEQRAREYYTAIIAAGVEGQLANDARFELGDLLAHRDEYDAAIKALSEALGADAAPDLAEKIRLRLGGCFLAKGDAKNAQAHFAAIAANPKSPLFPQAKFGLGECCMIAGDFNGAVQHFVPFRDQDPFKGMPMVADRALLRLGHACANLGQWDNSRVAMEALVNRFASSPHAIEARYGIGWAWQNAKQFDNAANAYADVINRSGAEVAAKAQLQIGLCRLEQKRLPEAQAAFMTVVYTYEYPEIAVASLCEAARVQVELKQVQEARKLLQRVQKDFPTGKWNDLATKRLAEIK